MQKSNIEVATLAKTLLPQIEADRIVLDNLANQIGTPSSTLKEAAAWVSQKAGRFKFNLNEPIGIFEAIEMLSLGVLGKQALWSALESKSSTDLRLGNLNFSELMARAQIQHQQLDHFD